MRLFLVLVFSVLPSSLLAADKKPQEHPAFTVGGLSAAPVKPSAPSGAPANPSTDYLLREQIQATRDLQVQIQELQGFRLDTIKAISSLRERVRSLENDINGLRYRGAGRADSETASQLSAINGKLDQISSDLRTLKK